MAVQLLSPSERTREAECFCFCFPHLRPCCSGLADDDDYSGGVRVPFLELKKYLQRDNTNEPIVGRHRDMKFLHIGLGDFTARVVKDGWSQPDGKGVLTSAGAPRDECTTDWCVVCEESAAKGCEPQRYVEVGITPYGEYRIVLLQCDKK